MLESIATQHSRDLNEGKGDPENWSGSSFIESPTILRLQHRIAGQLYLTAVRQNLG